MIRVLFVLIFTIQYTFCNDIFPGDSVVREGVFAFYNYEFDKSIEILKDAREQFPDHPGVHLIWAAARWVRSQAQDPIQTTYSILESDLNEVRPVYARLVQKFPNDLTYKLYQGSAIGLNARVSLGKKEWLSTAFHAYKGFIIIKDVYDKAPFIKDSRLPIGIIIYYAGISNTLLKYTVNFYGLDASTEVGINEISDAANSSDWAWIEATGILSFLYLWVEDDAILAGKYSRRLVKYFPNNFYYNILHLESLIKTEQYGEAYTLIKILETKILSLTERQKEWYMPYLDYEKALLAFKGKRYKKSLKFLDSCIENYTGELDIVLGNALLLRGMTLDKINRRSDAKLSYQACLNLNNFSSSMKKANQYLHKPYF